ncbi:MULTISPECIES: hypothetical protein [Leuconostoc]|uniref:hypothetical protein n=1 Tax=Leuconostoc TaxID=1243 RepID=UPI0002465982|nr:MULTISPECIES: hypothetical protein [Leuconostoc]MDV8931176.1 hypothetical protein [Leuconostoc citreum]OSP81384.1 hypothetical protein B9J75_07055 [Leuconostoc citreum]QEA46051.1 hypothetical protein FGL82_06580 [Leuconostoc citreum]QEA62741.1 hypothetical protein FGL72_02515 [Leuconostoc citreum]QGN60311.1 hypothetical protein GJ636_02455 [Leuconostoc citreum]
MDDKIITMLTESVVSKLSTFFEEGLEYEIITQRQDLAEFLTGKRRADVSRFLELPDFPQIRDDTGNVIGWSWRAIRKWELERTKQNAIL